MKLCGWDPERHVVPWGFERHNSQTQLNSSQPKLCPLVSSKHLWCPKNILEETGLQRNNPFWALRAFLCPSYPSLSLQDTSLSFIFPLHSQFCLCDLYCISVGAVSMFKVNNYCCISPSEQTPWQKFCEIKLCLYGLLLFCSEVYLMVLIKLDVPWVTYHEMCDNQRTCVIRKNI